MSQQKAISILIKKAQTLRAEGRTTNRKLNNLLDYQAAVLNRKKDDSIQFACFGSKSKPSVFCKGWQRAYLTLNRLQKANFYLNTCRLINGEVHSNKLNTVTTNFKMLVMVKNSNLFGGWSESQMQTQTQNMKLLFKQKKWIIDLQQYLVRHSRQQVKGYLVLESTVIKQHANGMQSIRISPSNPEQYETLFNSIYSLCFQALERKIIDNISNGAQKTRKQIQSIDRQKNIAVQRIYDLQTKQLITVERKQDSNFKTSRVQSQQSLTIFRDVIQSLDQFSGFSEPQQGVFQQLTGHRVKRIYLFDSKYKDIVFKHLSNYCYFYRFKNTLSSVSLVKKHGNQIVQIKEVYMYSSGQIIECSYCRKKIQIQNKIYFIDYMFKIKHDYSQSFLDQQSIGDIKVQNSYSVTEVRNMENGKIRILTQSLILFPFESQSKRSFTRRFIGNLCQIKLQPTIIQSGKFEQNNSKISNRQKDVFCNKQQGTVTNQVKLQQKQYIKLMINQKESIICGDNSGNPSIKDAYQKKKAQSAILKVILRNLGKQLLKGQSLMNMSMPIQVNGNQSIVQKIPGWFVYAPYLLQRVVKGDKISRFKAVVCQALSQPMVGMKQSDKPFNPIIGETYQGCIDGCPIYCEQISHHPPITSVLFCGRRYSISASLQPVFKMGLNSASAAYNGEYKVVFNQGLNKQQQTIKFNNINFLVEGLSFGDRKLIFVQFFQVYDQENNLFCRIQFGKNKKKGNSQINTYRDFFYGKLVRVANGFDFRTKKEVKSESILQQIGVFQGRWTQNILYNDQVIFDPNLQIPFQLQQRINTLDSHCNKRKDIQLKRLGRLQEAQNAKQELQKTAKSRCQIEKIKKDKALKYLITIICFYLKQIQNLNFLILIVINQQFLQKYSKQIKKSTIQQITTEQLVPLRSTSHLYSQLDCRHSSSDYLNEIKFSKNVVSYPI